MKIKKQTNKKRIMKIKPNKDIMSNIFGCFQTKRFEREGK